MSSYGVSVHILPGSIGLKLNLLILSGKDVVRIPKSTCQHGDNLDYDDNDNDKDHNKNRPSKRSKSVAHSDFIHTLRHTTDNITSGYTGSCFLKLLK